MVDAAELEMETALKLAHPERPTRGDSRRVQLLASFPRPVVGPVLLLGPTKEQRPVEQRARAPGRAREREQARGPAPEPS